MTEEDRRDTRPRVSADTAGAVSLRRSNDGACRGDKSVVPTGMLDRDRRAGACPRRKGFPRGEAVKNLRFLTEEECGRKSFE